MRRDLAIPVDEREDHAGSRLGGIKAQQRRVIRMRAASRKDYGLAKRCLARACFETGRHGVQEILFGDKIARFRRAGGHSCA